MKKKTALALLRQYADGYWLMPTTIADECFEALIDKKLPDYPQPAQLVFDNYGFVFNAERYGYRIVCCIP